MFVDVVDILHVCGQSNQTAYGIYLLPAKQLTRTLQ